MSDREHEDGTHREYYDSRDLVRNPYIAREILKSPPLEPKGARMPVQADIFNNDTGKLLSENVCNMDWRNAMPRGTVALLLPPDFDKTYGEALMGTAVSYMASAAMHGHMQVPLNQFASGNLYNHGKLVAHAIIMDREAYKDMAKSALALLADAHEGADFLGLKSAALYRQSMAAPDKDIPDAEDSNTRKIVINLLKHTGLTDDETRDLRQRAVASENYEFATLLAAYRKPTPGGPGTVGG